MGNLVFREASRFVFSKTCIFVLRNLPLLSGNEKACVQSRLVSVRVITPVAGEAPWKRISRACKQAIIKNKRVNQEKVFAFGRLWNKKCVADIQNYNVYQSVKG